MKNVATGKNKGFFFGIFGGDSGDSKESLEISGDNLIFTGGSKYQPILVEKIESINYVARDDQWQEINIVTNVGEDLNYYFNNDIETLTKAVEICKKALGPEQPICKFIMSAKPGSLSGRD